MQIELNDNVAKVAAYMQANFEAGSLVSIAKSISSLAPALWGRHDNGLAIDPIIAFTLPAETAPTASSQ